MYNKILILVALLILTPGAVMRVAGAPIEALGQVAWLETLATLAFLLTAPVSLTLAIRAAFQRAWPKALLLFVDALVPFATWFLLRLVNRPGYDNLMKW